MARKSQRIRRRRRIERLKAKEQEAKITKTIEDNSVILERMKAMSSKIDLMCETLEPEIVEEPDTPVVEMKGEGVEMKIQPFVETVEKTKTDYSKMTKKSLIAHAKDNGIKIRPSMNKNQLIKAIESSETV